MVDEQAVTASKRNEIAHCLRREMEERAAARNAAEVCARDAHSMLAMRFADRAEALAWELGDVSVALRL